MQKVGRHGSYATQFWTRPTRPPHRTRHAVLTAHSRKALQRRLVLPIDAHDWQRALEVLNARYARLGRTPEDYQRVIRGLATAVSPQQRRHALYTLEALRDKAYAGEIVTSGSFWVTLVWAYAQLRFPNEAYTCLLQAERRCQLSPLTRQHMAETLLPLLAESGMLTEVKYMVENFLNAGGSRQERARVISLVAEAAARSGSWATAITSLQKEISIMTEETVTSMEGNMNSTVNTTPRTLSSLFVNKEVVSVSEKASHSPQEVLQVSTEALRSMMSSMSDDGQWMMALHCLRELQQRSSSNVSKINLSIGKNTETYNDDTDNVSNLKKDEELPMLSEDELQRLLNCLGSKERWEEAIRVFISYYGLNKTPSERIPRSLHVLTLNLLFSSFPRESRVVTLVEDDQEGGEEEGKVTNNNNNKRRGSIQLQMEVLRHPQEAIALLNQLFSERDDVVVTDRMMAAVGPALLQLGHWERALHLLRQTPSLSSRKVEKTSTEANRCLREQLMALLYYLHHAISLEARFYTLYHFPFAFPKELFQGLPPPSELASYLKEMKQQEKKEEMEERVKKSIQEKREQELTVSSKLPESLKYRPFASRRRSNIVQNTEKHDDELKHRLTSLYTNRKMAFPENWDAESDPRPPPKGLHDQASGWNFYGRGGEMVFANHKRTAHPFTLHPKVMRSLADPYRGWSLKQNSCWGHRERVRKWNGHSAV
ncbi:uncharacterized protein TM35_000191520 [Trypanosoma theileri]|uniref:Uncharacterized protein n=1 Tax=Trypanosoma theileri TaxID=67003 RepID=A0A1X0NTP3_9TRYP|nr:uncharacterized protein TM35_000191520 [Trypanosoma theileri]ORC87908.1 hypothetical protein TM35_000191520 [Trypanosoma theileri]